MSGSNKTLLIWADLRAIGRMSGDDQRKKLGGNK